MFRGAVTKTMLCTRKPLLMLPPGYLANVWATDKGVSLPRLVYFLPTSTRTHLRRCELCSPVLALPLLYWSAEMAQ